MPELTRSQRSFAADGSDPRHGTRNGYVNLACRCPLCRDAWSKVCAQLRIQRAQRLQEAAQPGIEHGSISTYSNHSCRCQLCRDAWAYRARMVSAQRGRGAGGK